MKIPIPPVKNQVINADGSMSFSYMNYHNQISQQLRYYLNDEGYVLPSQTTDKLTSLAATKTQCIVYDTTKKEAQINNAGSFESIATSPPHLPSDQISAWASDEKNYGKPVFNTTSGKTMINNGGTAKEIQTVEE